MESGEIKACFVTCKKERKKAENDVHDGERRVGPERRKRYLLHLHRNAGTCNNTFGKKISQIYP